jgi:hypothetical protein
VDISLTAIAAVVGIIAGYLAIRNNMVRLKINNTTTEMVTKSENGKVREIGEDITITVSNVGSKTVTIMNTYCKAGIKKRYLNWNLFKPDKGTKLPTKLEEGDRAIYYLSRDFVFSCFDEFKKRHPYLPSILVAKYLFKFGVLTMTEKKYESRFCRTVQKRLLR